ncbi:MAG: DUF2914 domain-containing protein [Calditrichaeota bacterium]|nr:MAG: DUF2914 domain-containing protein [Calditrichota bacterium]
MKQILSDTTTRLRSLYSRHQKAFPILSFIAGFAWDSWTLNRIDRLSDNLILLAYILCAGLLIVINHLYTFKKVRHPIWDKFAPYLSDARQFFFGGLFSSYVVFYFKSAALTKNWLFVLFLLVLLVSNEFIKDRLQALKIQIYYFYLALFSFFIFFLPVVFKTLSTWFFIASGLLSGGFTLGMVLFLGHKTESDLYPWLKQFIRPLGIFYLLFNLLYFMNIIPPVPLSLKHAGIYHSVKKEGTRYRLTLSDKPWYQFYKTYDDPFYYTQKDCVYCFSAVFAPTDLHTRIYHRWQWYNPFTEQWEASDNLSYAIHGGRERGYRGYTYKKHLRSGDWRVDILNDQDQILGRVSFQAVKDTLDNRRMHTIYR